MEKEIIITELTYKAVRSSGAGGQNVNKVSSKVVLSFDLKASNGLLDEEKEWLMAKLKSKLTVDGVLLLNCDEDRSQLKNKELVTKRFFDMLQKALVKPKERKETKVPKAIVEKRLKEKASNAEIKNNRRKPEF